METDRLRYFCAIAEAGSLSAAAQILNVSHSGLSKAMSVLQSELNMQLFRPLGRGLELTELGQDVYIKSKQVLEQVEILKKPRATQAGDHVVRLGMTEVISLGFAGSLAAALNENHLNGDFYELDSGECEVRVLNGQIDFGLTFVPFPHPELEHLKIKKIEMGVYCQQPSFFKKSIETIPFVVPNHEMRDNPLSIKSRDGWPSQIKRQIQYGASSLSLALQIVDQGLAAVFMPKFLGHGRYLEIETKKSLFQSSDRSIFIVKKKNRDETRAMKIAAKILRTKGLV